jgi:hypothetical protein
MDFEMGAAPLNYRLWQPATFNGEDHLLVTEDVVNRALERRLL